MYHTMNSCAFAIVCRRRRRKTLVIIKQQLCLAAAFYVNQVGVGVDEREQATHFVFVTITYFLFVIIFLRNYSSRQHTVERTNENTFTCSSTT